MPEPARRYSLPENVLNDVIGYLATKPFNESAPHIAAMRENAVELTEPEPELEPVEKGALAEYNELAE